MFKTANTPMGISIVDMSPGMAACNVYTGEAACIKSSVLASTSGIDAK